MRVWWNRQFACERCLWQRKRTEQRRSGRNLIGAPSRKKLRQPQESRGRGCPINLIFADMAEQADALDSGNATLLKDMSIDKIWNNIIKYQGEQFFTTVKKKPFSYIVNGNSIVLQNTNRIIPRSNVERALEINSPTVSKFVGMNLQGPSYLLAIITDNRIIG